MKYNRNGKDDQITQVALKQCQDFLSYEKYQMY